MRWSNRVMWLALGGLAIACSGAPELAEDAGGDAALTDSGSLIEPDAGNQLDAAADAFMTRQVPLPDLPVLTPCPGFWTTTQTVATGCEPWPIDNRPPCPAGELLGALRCTPVGGACPAGEWYGALSAGATVHYVRQGGNRGDGSMQRPFGAIADALAVAQPGHIVALNKATFTESVSLPAGVTLQGACSAGTELVSPSGATSIVSSAGAQGALRNLTLRGPVVGVSVSGGSLDIHGVWIRSPRAIQITGGQVTAHLVITTIEAMSGPAGVEVSAGGSLTLTRAELAAGHARLHATGVGTRVVASGLVVPGSPSFGIDVESGAELSIGDSVVEHGLNGVRAIGAGTRLTITGSLVRGQRGTGIMVENGAVALLERSTVARANHALVSVLDGDLTLRDVLLDHPGGLGTGEKLNVIAGRSTMVGDRVALTSDYQYGLILEDSVATLSHLTIVGDPMRRYRGGIAVVRSALTLTRAHVARVAGHGLAAWEPPPGGRSHSVTATELTIEDVTTPVCASQGCPGWAGFGVGLGVYDRASIIVSGFMIRRSPLLGVQVGPLGAMDLSEGTISDNPIGANIQEPSQAPGRLTARVLFSANGVNLDANSLLLPPQPASILP